MNRLLNVKTLAVAAFFLAASFPLLADRVDDEAMKARVAKGSGTVILCSPYGKVDGTVGFDEAVKKAKRGTIVRLLPGFYNPIELPIFDDDGVIIEGDGSGGYVDVPLILYGRDIIVRNINARSIEAEDATIVDTKVHSITLTSSNRTSKPVVYNVCMNNISVYANLQEIALKNCTIVSGVDIDDSKVGQVDNRWSYGSWSYNYYSVIYLGNMVKKGKLEITECVINTNADLFNEGNKMLELTLKDNVIYVSHSAIAVAKDKSAVKLDAVEEHFAMKGGAPSKSNILAKPVFKREAKGWHDNWNLTTECFVLTPQSPGADKGWGVNMGPKGVPVPEEGKKK